MRTGDIVLWGLLRPPYDDGLAVLGRGRIPLIGEEPVPLVSLIRACAMSGVTCLLEGRLPVRERPREMLRDLRSILGEFLAGEGLDVLSTAFLLAKACSLIFVRGIAPSLNRVL